MVDEGNIAPAIVTAAVLNVVYILILNKVKGCCVPKNFIYWIDMEKLTNQKRKSLEVSTYMIRESSRSQKFHFLVSTFQAWFIVKLDNKFVNKI